MRACHARPEPFAGTAWCYARFRPGYPPAFVHVVRRFGPDDTGRLLDLGCGTGRLTIPLAPTSPRRQTARLRACAREALGDGDLVESARHQALIATRARPHDAGGNPLAGGDDGRAEAAGNRRPDLTATVGGGPKSF
jgi:hypothetical protein